MDQIVASLERELTAATSPSEKRFLQRQLNAFRSGLSGEKTAAYHIDFHFGHSPRWMVLHDLRLESGNRVAQIDHLVISRMCEIYVIESKNFRTKVRFQNGGWEHLSGRQWVGFPCPIEQNKRHITVLKELISRYDLAPKRIGIPLVSYKSVIAVNPSCSVVGSFPSDVSVWRMDHLPRELQDDDPGTLGVLNAVSVATIEQFARKLLGLHRPFPQPQPPLIFNDAMPAAPPKNSVITCGSCSGTVSPAEANFCRLHTRRFAGQVLCRKCQGFAPQRIETAIPPKQTCAQCGTPVSDKVREFCVQNPKRFGEKILCFTCQRVPPLFHCEQPRSG